MFIKVARAPLAEPVSLEIAKAHLRVTFDDDDNDELIGIYLQAARELVEGHVGKSYVTKGYVQNLDNFPAYTDAMYSQAAYPPSYYSQSRYSSNYWNYSQQIKLLRSPLLNVDRIDYIAAVDQTLHTLRAAADPWSPDTDYDKGDQITDPAGNLQEVVGVAEVETGGASQSGDTIPTFSADMAHPNVTDKDLTWGLKRVPAPGDFLIDTISEPARLFPTAGNYWPGCFFVPNAVKIYFDAGFGDDGANVPAVAKVAMLELLSNFYEFREPVSSLNLKEIPHHLADLLANEKIYDFAPTRG